MDRISMQTLAAAIATLEGKITDEKIEAKIADALEDFGSGITLKGSVNYESNLPNGADTGDEYIVLYSGSSGTNYIGKKYIWDGTAWRDIGTDMKLYRDADGDLCEED